MPAAGRRATLTDGQWIPDNPMIDREIAERNVRFGDETYGEGAYGFEDREA
ncbi:hypothetical protein WKW80_24240 [Variovorax humicola]|uniref:Uncharacterized protein n=1 Tax=Variovorax humicola TaxID=1769758 RepID=A0ABU8W4X3_9BURK